MTADLVEVDPFELPEWLGSTAVTWTATCGLRTGPRVTGTLSGDDPDGGSGPLACDLLAVDLAYPSPVVTDAVRTEAHRAWRHGQVLLLGQAGGTPLLLAVPGSAFTADLAIDALARLALAVGASADHYAVHLQIGRERRA